MQVVQNGRKHEVNIVKTPNKGWGVFAGDQAKIPKGSFIGIYAGEVIKDDEADRRGVVYNNKSGRTYLFDLDSYHLKYVTADGELQNKAERETTDEREKVEEWCSTYSIDAFHAGNFTRYVNHSCQPNCELWSVYLNNPNLNLPLLVFFTIRDIHPREELTFDYSGDAIHEEGQKPKHLNDNKCYCGAPQCKGYMFR
jgi:histone-lysine N-methyltransferase SUV39H